VATLSGVEISGNPWGIFFIFCASGMWAVYIMLGRRVAQLDRGLAGLGLGLVLGSVVIMPFGVVGQRPRCSRARRLLLMCVVVGALSSAIGYGIDQVVMRRIPVRRFAVLLALLPVSAMLLGFVALGQRPSPSPT
jgi:inner membrane transporter RhtA